ncbi:MAG: DUF2318 domain-containing protein [Desulfobacteraceae bacterium]|jgi:uncharacterized membrane protein
MKKSSKSRHQSKKDTVLHQNKRSINPIVLVLGVAFLAAAIAAGYFITDFGQRGPQTSAAVSTQAPRAGDIRYPVSMFADGKARHFDYAANGLTIRYFVLKSADGVIRAAFDACDVCWPAGKGYYQEGDEMVCRNCGRRFASVLINEVKGGCNPAPLHRTIQDDQLVIKIEDIVQGQTYFNFKERA